MMPYAGHVDWQTISNISTAAGVFVALAGVIVTFILTLQSQKLTRQGQNIERQQAEATAARSEAAAALTEEYTRRVVEALETMAQRTTTTASTALVRQGVKWSLTNYGGSTYLLENDSDTVARNVQVTAHETLTFRPPDPSDVAPGEALTFMASMTMGTRDSTITVHWTEDDPREVKTWKYPLPPRS